MAHLDKNINILSDPDWLIWFPKSDNKTVFQSVTLPRAFCLYAAQR